MISAERSQPDSLDGDNITSLCGGVLDGDLRPLIPDDWHQVAYLDYSTISLFGHPKVRVRFTIAVGKYRGVILERWYNVKSLRGAPRKYGDYVAGQTSNVVREYVALTGKDPRRDRMSWVGLKGVSLEAKTRTVIRDARHHDLAEMLRYSVVDELRRVHP